MEKKAKFIAIGNQKGEVGKSALTTLDEFVSEVNNIIGL